MNVVMTFFKLIFINTPSFIHHIDYLVSPKPQAFHQGKKLTKGYRNLYCHATLTAEIW